MRTIDELYKLLWEHIKHQSIVVLSIDISEIYDKGLIMIKERNTLKDDVYKYDNLPKISSTKGSKAFVQRMILETTPVITG
jgi:hypothetical protein